MGLSNVLGNALSGMRVTQSALDIVARNVANADTPGYTRKAHSQSVAVSGANSSVIAGGADRQLDAILQRQLRSEWSAGAYASQTSRFHSGLDALFGQPGGENALDTRFNRFTSSLQALSTSPDSFTVRAGVLDEARALAQHLNSMSDQVQGLRLDAERGLSSAVASANDALKRLEKVNNEIVAGSASGMVNPDLLDERDKAISELSMLMDVRVTERGNGSVSVSTQAGATLFDGVAATLSFDDRAIMSAEALYSTDASARGVGTIVLTNNSGHSIDLLRDGSIRSGEIAALVDMRDTVLVEAQDQLDELASELALALSSKTVAAEETGAGFVQDVSELSLGNSVSLTYDDAGTTRTVTLVNVTDESRALSPNATARPGDIVIGIDFSQSEADIAASINAALGANPALAGDVAVSAAAGGGLLFADGTGTVQAVAASVTETSLAGGTAALPMFVDGGRSPNLYSGDLEPVPQKRGFAGRIALNPALAAQDERLVSYAAGVPIGDSTRPDAIIARLTETARPFSPQSGIGSAGQPFTGTVAGFAQSVTAHRGREAAQAERLAAGQEIVVGALEERSLRVSGVNVDQEMANLVQLQNAFAANARVIQAVTEMMDLLLRMDA